MKATLLALSLVTALVPAAAHAEWAWSAKKTAKPDKTISAQVGNTASAALDRQSIEFDKEATQTFQQLQTLMTTGQYAQAMVQAKVLLDQARMRVSIDTQTRAQTILTLREGTLGQEYTQLGKALSEFTPETQNRIMSAVQSYRGGVYLDLLNLLKRTELIYVECFALNMQSHSSGHLLQMDIDKIKTDLLSVISIPILLRDPNLSTPMLIFDNEVANSDQNYLFNRELEVYLMQQAPTLGLRTDQAEQNVNALINQSMATKLKQFIKSSSGGLASSNGRTYQPDPRYAVGVDTYKTKHCYPADTKRQTYGNYVDDNLCRATYIVAQNGYGDKRCYPANSEGVPFGNYVEDKLCLAGGSIEAR